MERIYKYIIEKSQSGDLNKDAAIQLIKMLKDEETRKEDIAIIGMSAVMPSAANKDILWQNIRSGKDSFGKFPENRKNDIEDYLNYRAFCNKDIVEELQFCDAAYLEEIDKFDYKFFQMTPKQASLMDPHQRVFLETVYHAIEDAGYGGTKLSGSRTGVYVGFANNPVVSYGLMIYEVDPSSFQIAVTGNIPSIMPSRISYLLDLKGPSMLIDTACSSSLVSVHMACMGIHNGDCEIAIAGGVKLNIAPIDKEENRIGIESSDGRTRTFDDSSDGTGTGEGSAAVVLKSLEQAVKDGDNIYAVIKGSAINQDGTSMGITAPNPLAQADVITNAWKNAGIDPQTISYIEAHGTGTKIGDPIEIEGIQRAFSEVTDRKQFCAIGTVKTNVGHLFEASGITSMVKSVMSLKNKELPPLLNFNSPNRKISFENSPVYVNDKLKMWETDGEPRRCGISAFGFSGTNCHVVLEEFNEYRKEVAVDSGLNILALSAKSDDALKKLILNYMDMLNIEKELILESICYTANTGRGHYEKRIVLIIDSLEDLKHKIELISCADVKNIHENNVFYGDTRDLPENIKQKENFLDVETALKSLMEALKKDSKNIEILKKICTYYIQGANINWEDFYRGRKIKKASLPVYPFDRHRCWIDIPKVSQENMFYNIKWVEKAIESAAKKETGNCILVIKDGSAKAESIERGIKEKNNKVIVVERQEEFKKVDEDHFIINSAEDYEALFDEIKDRDISKVIFICTEITQAEGYCDIETELSNLENTLNKGVYSFLFLAKAVIKSGFKSIKDIVIVTENAFLVTGNEDHVYPQHSTVIGLGKIFGREYVNSIIRFIDVDSEAEPNDIINEILTGDTPYPVAYRKGQRLIEEFHISQMENIKNYPFEIREKGVYIITGGTGGIGFEIAKYLTSKKAVDLVFINRTKIPEPSEWDGILSCGEDKSLCSKIQNIRELEAQGSTVSCYSANVAHLNQMRLIIEEIRGKYGYINGIIHSAGIPAERILARRDEKDFKAVLAPKVQGTIILDKLTQKDELDFFVMFSSVATLFGAPSQGDYSAANTFLDAYAQLRNMSGKRTIAIDWVSWKETGMAYNTNSNQDYAFKAITNEKAIKGFETVMGKDIQRVLIGEINYLGDFTHTIKNHATKLSDHIIENINKYKTSKGEKTREFELVSLEEVVLKGKDEGDYTETERMVGRIWGETIGYKEISIYDNFYDLGGDSLLAMKILNLINSRMNAGMDLYDLLNYLTISDLSTYIDKLTASKSDKEDQDISLDHIEPVEKREYYPLSSQQKRLFLMHEINPESVSYNLPEAFKLPFIEKENLEAALKKLVERYEELRTSFEKRDGEPIQIIHDDIEINVECRKINIEDNSSFDIKSTMNDFIRTFDLSKPPLFRVSQIVLDDNENILLLDRHHIISDGFSRTLFISELYKIINGEELPSTQLHYKDYAVWQDKINKNNVLKEQEDYWTKLFSDKVPVLKFPTDYERPEIQCFEGECIYAEITKEVSEKLSKMAVENDATMFMLMFAAYNVLLYKYTGQTDLVVGIPVSGRTHYELENIMGIFVNTLVMRNKPESEMSFREFLARVRENTLLAFQNQDYQFDNLLEKLNIKRDMSRNPMFDTMFALQNVPPPKNIILEPIAFDSYKCQFDLYMQAVKWGDEWKLTLEYCTKLFKRETAEKLIHDYLYIIDSIASNPNIKIKEIAVKNKFEKEEPSLADTIEFNF